MRANSDAVFQRLAHALLHEQRIAGVKAAGDIGGRDQLQQRAIAGAAFAEVGI